MCRYYAVIQLEIYLKNRRSLKMTKVVQTLNVEGMSCSHCENAVKKSVGALNGVKGVNVDLKGKKVTVEYDTESVSLNSIKETIEDQGYDVK
jgi:copper chaperone